MGKTYKWAILGAGSIARKFASDLNLIENAQLYAVASRSQERADVFAAEFDIPKAYGSYEAMVSDQEVDIVYIASRHVGHYPDTLLCLEHGKAVLCEKPVAMNAAQFEKMVALAKDKSVFFMEALWTRFIPSFLKCKELVEQGKIGDVSLIESDFCFRPPYDPEGRLFNPMLGGGALLDVGLYPLFMALTIGSEVVDVKAMSTLTRKGIDTTSTILLQHAKGEQSVLFSSIVASGRIESIIHGSKGMLRLNKWWHIPTTLDFIPDEGRQKQYAFKEPGFGYQYEAIEVMNCLDKGMQESTNWSWDNSRTLINLLDKVRNLTGIKYPEGIEAT